ncbi:asparagine synthase-related protein [Parasphingorhabdus sp. DH2-15]|uniref:asparagine synthase-related protein n=1 Tax=Parasphingorhabdus sp. DH2-15 TaxID=3444112 RepID=UPI003F688F84
MSINEFSHALVADDALHARANFSNLTIGDVTLALVDIAPSGQHKPRPECGIFSKQAVHIVADCRLYNRDELLAIANGSSDTDLRLQCDAALIAALYTSRGEAGLDALRGDFAFALYDEDQDLLILRRDHFGIRPLYHSKSASGGFAFASLVRAFTGSGLVKAERDWKTSFDYLGRNAHLGSGTMVKGVKLLPAASQLTISPSGFTHKKYWQLKPPKLPKQNPDYNIWCAGLKQRFEKAVAVRLPDHGPVASELSAGLDAGGITATAANLLRGDDQHVDAFIGTISDSCDPELFVDESHVAQDIVAASNRITMTKVPHAMDDPSVMHQPEPDRIEGGYVKREERTCALAAQNGSDSILCGWGGDQSVTYLGHQAFSHALRRGNFAHVWGDVRHFYKQGGIARAGTRAASIIFTAALSMGWSRSLRKRWRGEADMGEAQRDGASLRSRYKPAPLRDHDGGNVTQSQIAGLNQIANSGRLNSMAATSARYGVQYSFPMLDVNLVEYMLTCPPEFISDRYMRRKVFRTIMRDVLPDSVRLREQKMLPAPQLPLRISENKANYLRRLAILEKDERLHQYIDFANIRRKLEALPDADSMRLMFRKNAEQGKQSRPGNLNASFLAVGRAEMLQKWLDEDGSPDF